MTFQFKKISSALLVSAFLIVPAYSAGDGGDSSTSTSTKSKEDICKETKGKVWNKKSKKCENAEQGFLDDDSIYETGRHLAMIGRYDEAITILNLAANADDKRVLNYLGYSYRKAGHIEVGLKYYNQALAVDPDYVLVREYLGEALIQKGDIDGAKAQLHEIAVRCGEACEPYIDLKAELVKINAI